MACAGCTVCGTGDGKTKGCQSGGCASGGCNRLNTYDWISVAELDDFDPFEIVEVTFKNGSRKDFFKNPPATRASTGDVVIVETSGGYDVGKVSLSGELVRLQMKKKRVREDNMFLSVLRKANERDLEKLDEMRSKETETMIRARVIARTLDLEMKVGDVEFQGDGRKATFYYTADGRVDFRELIRHYAREFKVKIEMRQIGARQESAKIGGIGSCGRELCCSTWLSDFKSVTTSAARYQNLAINQAKLSGQCGRLKCCLNYELDTYMEAFSAFPQNADRLHTLVGTAILLKTDIFKKVMYYSYEGEAGKGKTYMLEPKEVKKILELNARKERPADLKGIGIVEELAVVEKLDFEDVTGEIELPEEKRKKKKKKRGRGNRPQNRNHGGKKE